MIPIYEQGKGNGIGHSLDSFLGRFEEIIEEHSQSGRAKSFAFIFYDFSDRDLKRIMKNDGVFARLDRLSGSRLSVFYLHTGARYSVERFNQEFMRRLRVGPTIRLPCVVFFDLGKEGFENIAVAQLDSTDLVHGFHELYGVIENYLESPAESPKSVSKALTWIKGGTKFISVEALRAALRAVFGVFF